MSYEIAGLLQKPRCVLLRSPDASLAHVPTSACLLFASVFLLLLFLFCFSSDSLPLTHYPVPPLAAHDARALQARLVGKSGIHDAASSGSMGLVQDHILADGACVHEKK